MSTQVNWQAIKRQAPNNNNDELNKVKRLKIMYFNIGGHSFVQVEGQFTLQLLGCRFIWKYTKKQKQKKTLLSWKGRKVMMVWFCCIYLLHTALTSEVSCPLTDDQRVSMLTVRSVLRVLPYIKSNYQSNNNNNTVYQADPNK